MTASNVKTVHLSSRARESLWNGVMVIYFVLSLLFAARAAADVDTDARELSAAGGEVEVFVASAMPGRDTSG